MKLVLAAFLATLAPGVIITRHDRDDARYRQLGQEYAGVIVDLNVPRRSDPARIGGNGAGVLIAPTWVLTAAHVAAALQPGHPMSRVTGTHHVSVNGRDIAVTRVILHPEWRDQGPHDIALIELAEPAVLPRYAAVYARGDEAGKEIVVVGRGDTGTGLTGATSSDLVMRAATNRVDRVTPGEVIFDFDAPESIDATDLEGVSGPGDSGGPALFPDRDRLYVLGVSVAQDGQGRGPGRYGALEFYTRVSAYAAWIEERVGE